MESLERKEEAGEGMNEFVDRYINLYFNKSITKCVADAIQISRLFLSVKVAETLKVSVCQYKMGYL